MSDSTIASIPSPVASRDRSYSPPESATSPLAPPTRTDCTPASTPTAATVGAVGSNGRGGPKRNQQHKGSNSSTPSSVSVESPLLLSSRKVSAFSTNSIASTGLSMWHQPDRGVFGSNYSHQLVTVWLQKHIPRALALLGFTAFALVMINPGGKLVDPANRHSISFAIKGMVYLVCQLLATYAHYFLGEKGRLTFDRTRVETSMLAPPTVRAFGFVAFLIGDLIFGSASLLMQDGLYGTIPTTLLTAASVPSSYNASSYASLASTVIPPPVSTTNTSDWIVVAPLFWSQTHRVARAVMLQPPPLFTGTEQSCLPSAIGFGVSLVAIFGVFGVAFACVLPALVVKKTVLKERVATVIFVVAALAVLPLTMMPVSSVGCDAATGTWWACGTTAASLSSCDSKAHGVHMALTIVFVAGIAPVLVTMMATFRLLDDSFPPEVTTPRVDPLTNAALFLSRGLRIVLVGVKLDSLAVTWVVGFADVLWLCFAWLSTPTNVASLNSVCRAHAILKFFTSGLALTVGLFVARTHPMSETSRRVFDEVVLAFWVGSAVTAILVIAVRHRSRFKGRIIFESEGVDVGAVAID